MPGLLGGGGDWNVFGEVGDGVNDSPHGMPQKLNPRSWLIRWAEGGSGLLYLVLPFLLAASQLKGLASCASDSGNTSCATNYWFWGFTFLSDLLAIVAVFCLIFGILLLIYNVLWFSRLKKLKSEVGVEMLEKPRKIPFPLWYLGPHLCRYSRYRVLATVSESQEYSRTIGKYKNVLEIISSSQPVCIKKSASNSEVEFFNFVGYQIKDTNCIIDIAATWYKPSSYPELLTIYNKGSVKPDSE